MAGSSRTQAELRRFALVMTSGAGVVGGLLLWRGKGSAPYILTLGGLFLFCGLVAPQLLAPVERAWMALARLLAVVMTTIFLTLTFLLVITPFGLLLRLLGKDMLKRKFDKAATTYWEPVEPDGPAGRPEKPY